MRRGGRGGRGPGPAARERPLPALTGGRPEAAGPAARERPLPALMGGRPEAAGREAAVGMLGRPLAGGSPPLAPTHGRSSTNDAAERGGTLIRPLAPTALVGR